MSQIKGKDLMLYLILTGDIIPVCHATDCTINLQADIDETTTKTTGAGKTYDYNGKYGYTLELRGITSFAEVTDTGLFQDALMAGTKLDFQFTDSNEINYNGTVLVPEVDMDSPVDAMSVFTSQLLGDGELQKTEYGSGSGAIGVFVTIQDQFANIVAQVPAPGTFNVLVFNRLVQGGALRNEPDLIIISAEA